MGGERFKLQGDPYETAQEHANRHATEDERRILVDFEMRPGLDAESFERERDRPSEVRCLRCNQRVRL